ncbi:hypothetical protein B5C34_05230 [Pacificimonas flava]|uniref:DUF1320 domain-containing protein n=2 Tax=Pacificimonas TaxID=1960290 RepID=A0A219B400_9SPHN|nr:MULTISPECIES: DUF1320 domain-containing protein [Pacificimonas]MBZ6377379.1 DUF1320 domain-containing protein [Pacificimonas aurantium]OWV32914.1 hypothetical protein B5C34_05230 [Pacificimonas flava]
MTPTIKDVAETLDVAFDFKVDLAGGSIAEILSVSSELQPGTAEGAALSVEASSIAGTSVRIRLSGGADGGRYRVAVTIRDQADQKLQLAREFAGLSLAWSAPSGAARYLSLQRFIERSGVERAVQLTDELGRGTPDPETLGRAIADAEAEVDANLAGRYETPLASVPEIVETITYDLALARLYQRGEPPEAVRLRAKDAREMLRRLSSGAMQLPNAAAQTPAQSSSPILISSGGRQYPPGSLDRFSRG